MKKLIITVVLLAVCFGSAGCVSLTGNNPRYVTKNEHGTTNVVPNPCYKK